jgi:hypothetical protein
VCFVNATIIQANLGLHQCVTLLCGNQCDTHLIGDNCTHAGHINNDRAHVNSSGLKIIFIVTEIDSTVITQKMCTSSKCKQIYV